MAFTTFLDIVNAVLDEIDEDNIVISEDQDVVETPELRRVKRYVNAAYLEVLRSKPEGWSWATRTQTINLVGNQSEYGVADGLDPDTDFQNISLIRIGQNAPLKLVDYREFFRRYGSEHAMARTGDPFIAYVLGEKINLYIAPQQVGSMTVIARRKYTKLDNPDDEPMIPVDFRDILFYGATALAKDHDNETSIYTQQYQSVMNQLRANDGNSHTGHAMFGQDELEYAEQDSIRLLGGDYPYYG